MVQLHWLSTLVLYCFIELCLFRIHGKRHHQERITGTLVTKNFMRIIRDHSHKYNN